MFVKFFMFCFFAAFAFGGWRIIKREGWPKLIRYGLGLPILALASLLALTSLFVPPATESEDGETQGSELAKDTSQPDIFKPNVAQSHGSDNNNELQHSETSVEDAEPDLTIVSEEDRIRTNYIIVVDVKGCASKALEAADLLDKGDFSLADTRAVSARLNCNEALRLFSDPAADQEIVASCKSTVIELQNYIDQMLSVTEGRRTFEDALANSAPVSPTAACKSAIKQSE